MIQEPWDILDLQNFPKLARIGNRERTPRDSDRRLRSDKVSFGIFAGIDIGSRV
jgi:hypothetical protein